MILNGIIKSVGTWVVKMVKVIVIDDDVDTVEVFCEYLEIKDITVVGRGYNGKTAVELYEKLKPDIALLDVMMPEYDGFFALENIRQMNPDAKVIMVTADLTADTEKRLKSLNASAVIYKPYEIDSVIDTIHNVSKQAVSVTQ